MLKQICLPVLWFGSDAFRKMYESQPLSINTSHLCVKFCPSLFPRVIFGHFHRNYFLTVYNDNLCIKIKAAGEMLCSSSFLI